MASKALILALVIGSPAALAEVTESNMSCYQETYAEYVDISLDWYKDLLKLAATKDPEMQDVADWFMNGRQVHFEFNRTAFNWYLNNEPQSLHLNQPVESWLALDQAQVKAFSQNQEHPLQPAASALYTVRQGAPHPQNYALRSTFADLLSHPHEIDIPLKSYNQRMETLLNINCSTL